MFFYGEEVAYVLFLRLKKQDVGGFCDSSGVIQNRTWCQNPHEYIGLEREEKRNIL